LLECAPTCSYRLRAWNKDRLPTLTAQSGVTKMRMRVAVLSFALSSAIAFVALPCLARAQSAQATTLLRDTSALQAWVERTSQDVVAARAELSQARAEARGARLLPNPVADFSVANLPVGSTNPAGLGLGHTLILGVGLSETVELGKRGPRSAAADRHADAAEHRIQTTLGERVNDARQALARAVYASARAQALDEALTAAQAAADVAKGRLDHQALAGVDYDRLLIDLSSLQADVARAHAEQQAALETCAAALYAPCDITGAAVADFDAAATLPEPLSGHELEQRADLVALHFEREAAGDEALLASRRGIPDLTFRLGYTHDRFTVSGDNMNTLAVSVALPLPVFDHGQHDESAARARATELDAEAHSVLTQARGELAELLTRKRAVELTLHSIESDTLPRADSVLKMQEKGLDEGQLDMTDLLLARRQAVTLRLQALDLRFELFDVKNDIRRTLGLDDALAKK
jgi:cobalt-zinc-cadmium efflux system outer membrane protein